MNGRFYTRKRAGFYMIYAVLFVLSVGLACAFYVNQHYHSSQAHAQIHANAQLQLYARSIKDMMKLCLAQKGFSSCKAQEFYLPVDYHFRAFVSELDSHIYLLDIHGSVRHPSSGNDSRITRRYVLLKP